MNINKFKKMIYALMSFTPIVKETRGFLVNQNNVIIRNKISLENQLSTLQKNPVKATLQDHRISASKISEKDFSRKKINNPFKVIVKYNKEFSPLMVAIIKNDRKELKKLLKDKELINKPSFSGVTPIALAALSGDIKLIEYLKENGVDINVKDKFDRTPIIYAAMAGREDALVELIKMGADMNQVDLSGKKAMDYYNSRIIYRNLFKDDRKLEENKEKYVSKLCIDLDSEKLIEAIKKRDLNKVNSLLQDKTLNIDLNYKRPSKFKVMDGFTPIMYAALNENTEIVELLLKSGANVNERSVHGKTALIIADHMNNIKMKNVLLDNHANVEDILETRVTKKPLQKNKKTAVEILKENVTMENNSNFKKEVDQFFKKLDTISNYHLKLIIHAAALSTLDKQPIRYYFTENDSINDLTYNPINSLSRGEYDMNRNSIRVSNITDSHKALGIFIHETTHMLRMLLKDKEYDSLLKNTLEMKNRYYGEKLYAMKTPSCENFRLHVIERTDKGIRYSNIHKIVEENIADYSRLILQDELLNKGRVDQYFERIIEPLKTFFDKKMATQLEMYINSHPRKNELVIPTEIQGKYTRNEKICYI